MMPLLTNAVETSNKTQNALVALLDTIGVSLRCFPVRNYIHSCSLACYSTRTFPGRSFLLAAGRRSSTPGQSYHCTRTR